ncbi:hypothetical protein [Sunxiuqinia elliptica]|uniref:Uncharacterized protein n=1 Tax=Sunxiuqinia elliptica TaxID=655355 RepID=A0A4R6GRB8_9BACT|nr:hypothetical protein [Sunxiuqinia elliptica]TDN97733.1 hypothetical protein DET52_109135 [Sunxiuqinia elliptica]TDO67088.1 hypothetical protein DET65_0457 [Sunxiuqinia elliptica]
MRELGKFLLVLLILGLIGCGLVLTVLSLAFSDKKEIIELYNSTADEKIYLLKTSWGLNDSRMAIGLNNSLKGGFKHKYPDKYVSTGTGDYPILYKLDNDTLHIYGGTFKKPTIDKFMTNIKLHELNVSTRIHYSQNYKTMGLKIFPEFQTYLIENFGK